MFLANRPGAFSLCLFRVAQEALQNAVKYSGTNQFTVGLLGMVELRFSSPSPTKAQALTWRRRRGIVDWGWLAWKNGIHLVHGTLSIESHGQGSGKQGAQAVVPAEVDEGAGAGYGLRSGDDPVARYHSMSPLLTVCQSLRLRSG